MLVAVVQRAPDATATTAQLHCDTFVVATNELQTSRNQAFAVHLSGPINKRPAK
jgi:hypothetical protein